jgi:hypothetical protein
MIAQNFIMCGYFDSGCCYKILLFPKLEERLYNILIRFFILFLVRLTTLSISQTIQNVTER